MKQHRYTKLLGWVAAAALLAPSCKDEILGIDGPGAGEVTVRFTLVPEASSVSTRTVLEDGNDAASGEGSVTLEPQYTISDGSKADVLIYALYDKEGRLLEHYQDESDDFGDNFFTPGDGQTVKNVKKDGGSFPYEISLNLKRGEEYTIAFWAQSSQCHAYNVKDLRKVEVIYGELEDGGSESGDTAPDGEPAEDAADPTPKTKTTTPNNDERRDAFCRKLTFVATENAVGGNKTVYLYRPLAQINVGTTGYDYEIVNRHSKKKYTYSKIRLNRVARYLDIFADQVYSSTTNNDPFGSEVQTPESFAVVDFGYAKLPAYVNMPIPDYPSHTIFDWIYYKRKNPDSDYSFTGDNGELLTEIGPETYAKEEFLRVHLDRKYDETAHETPELFDDTYRGYANLNDYNYDDTNTETFKYLSMCYVLVPSTQEVGTTISDLKVWLATDEEGHDSLEVVHLTNVPVQRNWRTNIIGNIFTEENHFITKLDKDFAGEYNGVKDKVTEWSGPLHYGVFYDAESDVIQISNREGLLWFQRMVNGALQVREWKSGDTSYPNAMPFHKPNGDLGAKIGNAYYQTALDKDSLEYVAYGKNSVDDELRERILRATHQDTDQDKKGWPENNNFHFAGATVKLMADIDLSGVEWIPIGFDGRIAETVRKLFDETDATNRGFYGTFDGNNHTISNLSTKRFGARVPDDFQQDQGRGPYDVPQWFARGLFGMIGGDAIVKNVRLINVDVYGCQCVGAVVGAAQGDKIQITDCIVDGGQLIVTPMYRGDGYDSTKAADEQIRNRSFARGVYLGGIVGYFLTDGGVVERCVVRNVFMQGYRRVGGLIGSTLPIDLGDNETEKNLLSRYASGSYKPGAIADNKITNTIILASQFSTFGMCSYKSGKEDDYDKIIGEGKRIPMGFGWGQAQFNLYAQELVGGQASDQYKDKDGNILTNVTFAEIREWVENGTTPYTRVATIQSLPLNYMPMLSAWYADDITLYANYYGPHSATTRQKLKDFTIFSTKTGDDVRTNGEIGYNSGRNTFKFPMNLPSQVDVTWNDGGNVGIYVGAVSLSGKGGPNDRSVITPSDVSEEGACAIYVCPENRLQYKPATTDYPLPEVSISDLAVRGEPYAYTGVLLAPNKNTTSITLKKLAIYDVYQTIATDKGETSPSAEVWPNTTAEGLNDGSVELVVDDCNLRGYTVPGADWKSISYNTTTFERGTSTGHGEDEYTLKVENNGGSVEVTFTECIFKAPYVIDLKKAETLTDGRDEIVKFERNRATAAKQTDYSGEPLYIRSMKDNWVNNPGHKCVRIEITSDAQGYPIVTYYDEDNNGYLTDGKKEEDK